ncbi:MAG: ShET2/EspL2 family type III secretion system effector toxin [Pseudomonadota bacterium]
MFITSAARGHGGAASDRMAAGAFADQTPTGSPAQAPPQKATEPRQALLQALGDGLAGQDAAVLADTLLDCVTDGHLDLTPTAHDLRTGSPLARLADRLGDMPLPAWQALADHAAGTGRPLTGVSLRAPAAVQDLAAVVRGLNALTELGELRISPSRSSDELDLHLLAHAPAQLTVRLACTRPGAWQLQLPPGMACTLEQGTQGLQNPGPATVRYVNAAGIETQTRHKLDEFLYYRNDKAASSSAQFQVGAQGQGRSMDIQLNGVAHFDSKAAERAALTHNAIVCRHLVAHHLTNESRRSGGHTSFDDFKSIDAIQAAVSAETEALAWKMLSGPAAHVFQSSGFSRALHAELRTMKPGEERRFVLGTDLHAMSVTLRAKKREGAGQGTAFVVRLYDPNRTATHLRLALSHPDRILQPRYASLQDWIGPQCASYFKEQPETARLYRWDRLEPSTTPHGAPAPKVDDKIQRLRERDEKGYTAIHSALRAGQADQVTAMVRALGEMPSPISQFERFTLLRAAFRQPDGAVPAMGADIVSRQPDAAIAYIEAVLALPRECLTVEHRMQLLEARVGADGPPLIHALCARPPTESGGGLPPEHEALYRLAMAVAGSDKLLPRQKAGLLTSVAGSGFFGRKTAVDAAMGRKDARAVAALMAGILKSSARADERKQILAALKMAPASVLKKLDQGPEALGVSCRVAHTLLTRALQQADGKGQ